MQVLRVQDVRNAYRLVGECRDLGSDPALWQARMLDGLCRLVGAAAAIGGEARLDRPRDPIVPVSSFESGLDAHGRQLLAGYLREGGPAADPFIRALSRVRGEPVTRRRRDLVPDAAYCRSAVFDRYLRPSSIHYRLASLCRTTSGRTVSVLHLQRPRGDRSFSARETALLDFFHGEVGPLIGRSLASAGEPAPAALSPRLRQTLACLADGDSEKQVAARLGVSPTTVHEYVTSLYRRFGARSRAQLLAHVLRRSGRGPWPVGPGADHGLA